MKEGRGKESGSKKRATPKKEKTKKKVGRPKKRTPRPRYKSTKSSPIQKKTIKQKIEKTTTPRKSYRGKEAIKKMEKAIDQYNLEEPLIKTKLKAGKLNLQHALVRKIAKKFAINPRSMRRRLGLEGKTSIPTVQTHRVGDSIPGQFQVALTPVAEEVLVDWIEDRELANFPISRFDFDAEVGRVTNGKLAASNCMYYGFIERHPHLETKITQTYSDRRSNAKTTRNLKNHFEVQNRALAKCAELSGYDVLKPRQKMNLDEKPVVPKNSGGFKVLGRKGIASHTVKPENISCTGVEQVYANGHVGPRLVILQGKKLDQSFDPKTVDPNLNLASNEKGGMTRKLWRDHMIPLIVASKPPDLLENEWVFCSVDGFDAHLYGSESLALLKKNKIMLFQETAQCSDEIQVLDLSVFGPYAAHEQTALKMYRNRYGSAAMTQIEFLYVYCHAMNQAQTPENIASGFKKAGLHPSLNFYQWRAGPGKNAKLVDTLRGGKLEIKKKRKKAVNKSL